MPLIFEAEYFSEYVQIHPEEFELFDGPSREAFFQFIQDEGEARSARVRMNNTVLEEREYR